MRSRAMSIRYTDLAPNSAMEMDVLYLEATGQASDLEWEICRNRSGKTVYKEHHVQATPEEAAQQLMVVARNATAYLSMLMEMNPELCRRIAATESQWPVMVDLRETDWSLPIAQTISKIELGKDIKGYLFSAQTSHRNVIRRWAAAIYETLLYTRFDFKAAQSEKNRHKTTDGCPEWARKTLDLPQFTKANAREWARLGEEMLLQQMPGFLDHPDFLAKKTNWTHRATAKTQHRAPSLRADCHPSPRGINREAFEDLAKELKNIAPERELWLGEW